MITDEQIEAAILLKLYKRGNWGASHTSFENLKKGFKVGELGKKGLKRIDGAGKGLIKKGFIIRKPTHYGLEVSLNPRENKRICDILRKHFKI